MSNQFPSEVVFSIAPGSTLTNNSVNEICVIPYDQGPVKVIVPLKRGRPKKMSTTSTQVGGDEELSATQDYDFIPVTHFRNHENTVSSNIRTQDALRRVIRKRVMITHLREKRRKDRKTSQNDHDIISSHTQKHYLFDMPYTGKVDPFDATPFKLEAYMYDLLKYFSTTVSKALYSIEQKAHFNPIAEYWLPMSFQDSALLHVFIGLSESFTANGNMDGRHPLALKHLTEAIAIVNGRVINIHRDGISNATLAAIATIAIIQKSRGCHEQWENHIQGLEKLVRIRGGFDSLAEEPLIMGQLYRADLYGSIDAFQRPYFTPLFLPSLSLSAILCGGQVPHGFQRIDHAIGMDLTVKSCIKYLDKIVNLIWSLPRGSSGHAAETRFWITTVQYTLLSNTKHNQNRDDETAYDAVHEILRLVLIIYTAAMIDERPPGATSCDMLITRLRVVWLQYVEGGRTQGTSSSNMMRTPLKYDDVFSPDFKFWTMLIAASIASIGSDISKWCLLGILDNVRISNIQTWEEAQQLTTERFLPLCDVRCEKVWNVAQRQLKSWVVNGCYNHITSESVSKQFP